MRQPANTMATIVEGDTLMRPIDRPPPGDRLASKCTPESQKRRSTYYQTEFAATNRESNPAKTRVHNEAIVMAELKTNVIVSSASLSAIYPTDQWRRRKCSQVTSPANQRSDLPLRLDQGRIHLYYGPLLSPVE